MINKSHQSFQSHSDWKPKTLSTAERSKFDLNSDMKIKFTITLSILLFQSMLAISQTHNDHYGIVIFNLKFSSFNESGFGGKIKIINTTTGIEYKGKSPNPFNSQIIIKNLPEGNYQVVELIIKMGQGQIGYYDSSKFNQIKVEVGKTSYLGMYKTKKTSQLFKLNYELLLDENFNKEKIEKQFSKINVISSDIDFSQKLLKSDTTYFSIK